MINKFLFLFFFFQWHFCYKMKFSVFMGGKKMGKKGDRYICKNYISPRRMLNFFIIQVAEINQIPMLKIKFHHFLFSSFFPFLLLFPFVNFPIFYKFSNRYLVHIHVEGHNVSYIKRKKRIRGKKSSYNMVNIKKTLAYTRFLRPILCFGAVLRQMIA